MVSICENPYVDGKLSFLWDDGSTPQRLFVVRAALLADFAIDHQSDKLKAPPFCKKTMSLMQEARLLVFFNAVFFWVIRLFAAFGIGFVLLPLGSSRSFHR